MENLFESLDHPDSVMFLLSMLVSFLIGFVAAWALWSGRAKRAEREAANWKKQYDGQAQEMLSLREKHDLSTADLAQSKRAAELALDQAAAVQSEKMKWQKDLDQSLDETVKLQASNYTYQATIEDLNNQIIGLSSHKERLAGKPEGDGAITKTDEVATSHGSSLEHLTMLEGQINHLIAENENLRAVAKKEDEHVMNLLKSYKDSTNRLGGLEEKLGNLMLENEALRSSIAEHRAGTVQDISTITSEPHRSSLNPADKEAIIGGAFSPSSAKEEVEAAIGNTIPFATHDQKDDLTDIKGIGSFLEKKLNGIGIFTFEQISCLDANLIEKVTTAVEFFPGRIERDDWVGQAKRLTASKKPQASPAKPDNLKMLEGIGPKIEKLMFDAGIQSFNDLANASVEHLKGVLHQGGDHYRIHDPSSWPEQARLAASGKLKELKAYQDFLSGGKEPE